MRARRRRTEASALSEGPMPGSKQQEREMEKEAASGANLNHCTTQQKGGGGVSNGSDAYPTPLLRPPSARSRIFADDVRQIGDEMRRQQRTEQRAMNRRQLRVDFADARRR